MTDVTIAAAEDPENFRVILWLSYLIKGRASTITESTLFLRVKEVIAMGGAINKGNISPVAEFNTYADIKFEHDGRAQLSWSHCPTTSAEISFPESKEISLLIDSAKTCTRIYRHFIRRLDSVTPCRALDHWRITIVDVATEALVLDTQQLFHAKDFDSIFATTNIRRVAVAVQPTF
ncbi:hypothetical protein BHE90_017399 [Fusarium euwallaceae]|uniref:Inosine/uridine-preferring nucleoside hydrolase domain-containing protein n=1 Tax=Fusarium euwallaceae TaxID=1147111 RepID=A0A430KXZ3_9HYPO|nr:hypothetical protein BHE90_017399 [Fusarium euwallaceae]